MLGSAYVTYALLSQNFRYRTLKLNLHMNLLVHFYTRTETRSQVNALVVGKSTRCVDV
jgi:hypothetical protein